MIKEIHKNSKPQPKERKGEFVAFTNERDSLGRIIKRKAQKKNEYNILQLFENLKKSTKEYFFDKQFEKMSKKFEILKRNIEASKDYDFDYEIQVGKCIQIANKFLTQKEEGQRKKQNLYINLRNGINKKIEGITTCLKRIKDSGRKRGKNIKSQCILQDIEKEKNQINTDLFRSLSPRSEMMATFCSTGQKYSQLVDKKKFNPWKTWYKNYEYELFPGKKVQVKCLQKSIYD